MPYEILRDVEAHVKVHVEIPRLEVIVLEKLATYANAISRCAYPSIRTLADLTRYSVRSVQRILRELENHGLIKAGLKLSERGTVIYRILVPRRNGTKSRNDKMATDPYKPEKEKRLFAHAHETEIEIRQKTNDELNSLQGSDESAQKFSNWIARTLGKGFSNLCNNEIAQINLS